MKRVTLTAMAALLMTTSANAEETRTLYQEPHTYWRTWDVAQNSAGLKMCGMSTMFRLGNIYGRMHLKLTQNGLYIEIAKDTWKFADSKYVTLEIVFDGRTNNWVAKAETSNTNLLTIKLADSSAVAFLKEFQSAERMQLQFKKGEQPWVANMAGSRKAGTAFAQCSRWIDSAPSSSQPDTDDEKPTANKRGA